MKKILLFTTFALLGYGVWQAGEAFFAYQQDSAAREAKAAHDAELDRMLDARIAAASSATSTDPFGDDDAVSVLLVGLDSRAGQESAHCDAIQFIQIDRAEKAVSITAVPRGTYSPLPPGTGTTSSDYYVSNACALGGIEYGITQIERIVGQQADYVVFVGFSETLGILRTLKLPTTETLQWLRHRQGYAIGEPQRARNHSNFLKSMLLRFLPEQQSRFDRAMQYVLYKTVDTDLTFDQAQQIVSALTQMQLAAEPERITLAMKPVYDVQDFRYDPDTIDEHLAQYLKPIAPLLNKKDYSGQSTADIQQALLEQIEQGLDDPSFVSWAFEHKLWLQVEDDEKRHHVHYDVVTRHADRLSATERTAVLQDYMIEMQHRGLGAWENKVRDLLNQ